MSDLTKKIIGWIYKSLKDTKQKLALRYRKEIEILFTMIESRLRPCKIFKNNLSSEGKRKHFQRKKIKTNIPGERNYKGNLLFSISVICFPLYLLSARDKNKEASQKHSKNWTSLESITTLWSHLYFSYMTLGSCSMPLFQIFLKKMKTLNSISKILLDLKPFISSCYLSFKKNPYT